MEKMREWSIWESSKNTRGICLFPLKTEITQPEVSRGEDEEENWEGDVISPIPDARKEAYKGRGWKNERGGGMRYGGGDQMGDGYETKGGDEAWANATQADRQPGIED